MSARRGGLQKVSAFVPGHAANRDGSRSAGGSVKMRRSAAGHAVRDEFSEMVGLCASIPQRLAHKIFHEHERLHWSWFNQLHYHAPMRRGKSSLAWSYTSCIQAKCQANRIVATTGRSHAEITRAAPHFFGNRSGQGLRRRLVIRAELGTTPTTKSVPP